VCTCSWRGQQAEGEEFAQAKICWKREPALKRYHCNCVPMLANTYLCLWHWGLLPAIILLGRRLP